MCDGTLATPSWRFVVGKSGDHLRNGKLTGAIIGSAIEVHRSLGPGFLERVYEEALCVELGLRSVPFERQAQVEVEYKGQAVGLHQLDLLVGDRVVVELKATRAIERVHFAVVRSYLRALGLQDGLIINFATNR